jgi:hypothetical protein
MGERVDYG